MPTVTATVSTWNAAAQRFDHADRPVRVTAAQDRAIARLRQLHADGGRPAHLFGLAAADASVLRGLTAEGPTAYASGAEPVPTTTVRAYSHAYAWYGTDCYFRIGPRGGLELRFTVYTGGKSRERVARGSGAWIAAKIWMCDRTS